MTKDVMSQLKMKIFSRKYHRDRDFILIILFIFCNLNKEYIKIFRINLKKHKVIGQCLYKILKEIFMKVTECIRFFVDNVAALDKEKNIFLCHRLSNLNLFHIFQTS